MEANIKMARENMLEWWDIFSVIGNIDDARMLMQAISLYDKLILELDEGI